MYLPNPSTTSIMWHKVIFKRFEFRVFILGWLFYQSLKKAKQPCLNAQFIKDIKKMIFSSRNPSLSVIIC